jgi:hypothetical protein
MKAAIYGGTLDITVGERPDPRITASSDAIVRVTLALQAREMSPHAGSKQWRWACLAQRHNERIVSSDRRRS